MTRLPQSEHRGPDRFVPNLTVEASKRLSRGSTRLRPAAQDQDHHPPAAPAPRAAGATVRAPQAGGLASTDTDLRPGGLCVLSRLLLLSEVYAESTQVPFNQHPPSGDENEGANPRANRFCLRISALDQASAGVRAEPCTAAADRICRQEAPDVPRVRAAPGQA